MPVNHRACHITGTNVYTKNQLNVMMGGALNQYKYDDNVLKYQHTPEYSSGSRNFGGGGGATSMQHKPLHSAAIFLAYLLQARGDHAPPRIRYWGNLMPSEYIGRFTLC